MPNFEIDKLEIQKKIDSLPENIKKEFLADKNAELIFNTCQDYGLNEEQIKKVAFLVGQIFIGFLKPEELAAELHESFDIDLQKSNFIEIELKQKLFAPLKADLDKIYNPPKLAGTEEAKEAEPTVIKLDNSVKLEKEATPISAIPTIPLQKPSAIITEKKAEIKTTPSIIGATPIKDLSSAQPIKSEPTIIPKIESPVSEGPFVIHTQSEPVKPLTPQFPKETPSLNLKVDESLIQKTPTIKPISVRLESNQQASSGPKFQMPVFAKPESKPELKPTITTAPIQPKPIPTPEQKPEVKPIEKAETKINIPVNINKAPAPSLKQISEEKKVPETNSLYQAGQPAKVVHYSAFKTPLTPAGTPKKPEPSKESEYINLSTFTKVSGNTVDLRQHQDKK